MTISTRHLRRWLLAALVFAYGVLWVGGLIAYVFLGSPPPQAAWTAPVFLLLAGLLIIVTAKRQAGVALLIAAVLGFASEVLGVHYGFLFGRYEYTATLAPKLFGVPLVMMSAWMVLTAYLRQLLRLTGVRRGWQILFASLWMTAIDLVIDPLAAGKLDYWRWLDTGVYYGVPAHNFFGWFAVSLIIFSVIAGLSGDDDSTSLMPRYIGLSIVSFFTVIAFALGLTLAGLIGVALGVLHIALVKGARRSAA